MNMIEFVESRIAEYGPEMAPDCPYGTITNWREWLDGCNGEDVIKIVDDPGVEVWTDNESLLISFDNGGEELRYKDDFCAHVRAINSGDASIEAMDDDELWEKIINNAVDMF